MQAIWPKTYVSFVNTKLSLIQAKNRKDYQITTFLRGKKQNWFHSEGRIEPIEKVQAYRLQR